ncbi:MAG: outer membrane protein transport protein [Caulobacteraceae bacterium]|nr:outer membrane protein transport protein [Caulobacteraceae bacterium]
MPTLRHALPALALSSSLLALAGPAAAAGFYLQEQSVKGLGRAYSGEAADTGPESLWWNPASIAGVDGVQAYAGANLILSQSELDDHGSTIQRPGQPTPGPIGGASTAHNPLKVGVVPNLDAAWRVSDHVALGLAVSAPFDFITKYSPDSFARYQALTSRLLDLDVQPTVAVRVNRFIDLGVGLDAQYAKSSLSSALPNLSSALPDGSNTLNGDGWNYGWTAGVQLHPSDRFSLGASYRSQIDHTLSGTASIQGLLGPLAPENGVLPASAKFSTPWIVVVGGRYILNDHWALNAQIQRVGWSVFNSIRVQDAAGLTAIPQGYRDTTTEAIGVDYTVNRQWTLRSGVAYDPTPTPDIGRSARVPDGNRLLFTVGGSYRPTSRIELEGALAYVHLQRSPVVGPATAYAGTPVVTPILYDASAGGDAVIISEGVKFRF